MPTVPVRGVGEIGVIADVIPHDLPLKAWTDARNVRFSQGAASRSSIYKTYDAAYSYSKEPVGLVEGSGSGSEGFLVTVFADGSMEENHSGTTTDVTPTGVLGTSSAQITTAYLGDVTYVNRTADVPVWRTLPQDGAFKPLTDYGWEAGDRAYSLRAYKDFLIALNVTKTTNIYPAMVKWSDAAQAGLPPSNWDVADVSSLAGENVLNDVRGHLVDGAALGADFIIYGQFQTYRMSYIGEPYIFTTQKIFEDQGMIARNCAVAIDSYHYVFGRSDIYVHDGMIKQSLVSGRIRDRVFSELDFAKADRCFVAHDQFRGEILFHYPSVASDAPWDYDDVAGCNRAAVYNYRENTWSFVDTPAVVGEIALSQSPNITWADEGTWNASAAAWASFDGTRPRMSLYASAGNAVLGIAGQPYFLDDMDGGRITNQAATDILWPAFIEGFYKDVDEIGVELYGRKMVKRLVPQVRTNDAAAYITMALGVSHTASGLIRWDTTRVIDPNISAKYDTRASGRYISLRIDIPAGSYAEFSGYDVEIMQIAGR